MRRSILLGLAIVALSAGGIVYAQQSPPPAQPLPDPLGAPPESLPDPLGQPPPGPPELVIVPVAPDPALTAQENAASSLVEAAVAEEVDPADLAPPPPPPAPLKRPRYAAAVLQAVDKVSAETLKFEAEVGKPVRFKTLVFTVRACEGTAADEDLVEQMAHVEVRSEPKPITGREPVPGREVFRGWTFASAPSLNPFEHPVYDAWLISCKTSVPAAAGGRR